MSNLKQFYGRTASGTRYTSSTTWTNPGTVDAVYVTGVGGGGGSSGPIPGGYGIQPGRSGGGGGYVSRRVYWVGGSPTPVTVGAGGATAGLAGNGATGPQSRVGPTTTGVIMLGGQGGTQTTYGQGGYISYIEPLAGVGQSTGYRQGGGYMPGNPGESPAYATERYGHPASGSANVGGSPGVPTTGAGGLGSIPVGQAGSPGFVLLEWFE